jgi:hypothetical protein
LKELDSIQNRLTIWKCLHLITGSSKGIYSNRKQYTRRASRKVLKILLHNLPKVLFLFMPFSPLIFGFSTTKTMVLLWSWHFYTSLFSFLLLIFLLLFLTNKVLSLFQESSILSFSTGIINGFGWMVYYFYPAHHRFTMKHDWFPSWKAVFYF